MKYQDKKVNNLPLGGWGWESCQLGPNVPLKSGAKQPWGRASRKSVQLVSCCIFRGREQKHFSPTFPGMRKDKMAHFQDKMDLHMEIFKIWHICSQKFWIFVCLFYVLHTYLGNEVSIKFHKDLYSFFSICILQQNLVEVEWNQFHWQIPYTWEHRIGRLFFKDHNELLRDGLNSTFVSVDFQCKSNPAQVQMCTSVIGLACSHPLIFQQVLSLEKVWHTDYLRIFLSKWIHITIIHHVHMWYLIT